MPNLIDVPTVYVASPKADETGLTPLKVTIVAIHGDDAYGHWNDGDGIRCRCSDGDIFDSAGPSHYRITGKWSEMLPLPLPLDRDNFIWPCLIRCNGPATSDGAPVPLNVPMAVVGYDDREVAIVDPDMDEKIMLRYDGDLNRDCFDMSIELGVADKDRKWFPATKEGLADALVARNAPPTELKLSSVREVRLGRVRKLVAEIQAKHGPHFSPSDAYALQRSMTVCGMDEYPEPTNDLDRASGQALCEKCGQTYSRHPFDWRVLGYDNKAVLHILCDGTRVKL